MKINKAFGFASLLLIAGIVNSSSAYADAASTAGLFPGGDPDHNPHPIYNPVPVPVCQVDKNVQLNQQDVTLEQLLTFLERFPDVVEELRFFLSIQFPTMAAVI